MFAQIEVSFARRTLTVPTDVFVGYFPGHVGLCALVAFLGGVQTLFFFFGSAFLSLLALVL